MCGIVGILGLDSSAARFDRALIDRMSATLAHRGPDATGALVEPPVLLGHRSLSIIDLTAAGCQPMDGASGRFVMVYNGEVYNYLELRDQLRDRGPDLPPTHRVGTSSSGRREPVSHRGKSRGHRDGRTFPA